MLNTFYKFETEVKNFLSDFIFAASGRVADCLVLQGQIIFKQNDQQPHFHFCFRCLAWPEKSYSSSCPLCMVEETVRALSWKEHLFCSSVAFIFFYNRILLLKVLWLNHTFHVCLTELPNYKRQKQLYIWLKWHADITTWWRLEIIFPPETAQEQIY